MNTIKTYPPDETNRPAFEEVERADLEHVEGGIGPIVLFPNGCNVLRQISEFTQN